MHEVSDAFLLQVAEISATLIGLFLVGLFFYVETGFRRLESGVVLMLVPWILGGLYPSREDLTWAILLSLGAGFLSVCTVALSVFDTAGYET
jgi:hypothetical protein